MAGADEFVGLDVVSVGIFTAEAGDFLGLDLHHPAGRKTRVCIQADMLPRLVELLGAAEAELARRRGAITKN